MMAGHQDSSAHHPMMVEITQIKGEQALMNQRLDSSLQAMASHLQALQGDFRSVANQQASDSALLHQLAERSSGLERLATAIERGGGTNSDAITALKLAVAEWKGLVKGVALCAAITATAVTTFVVYRFDIIDNEMRAIRSELRVVK